MKTILTALFLFVSSGLFAQNYILVEALDIFKGDLQEWGIAKEHTILANEGYSMYYMNTCIVVLNEEQNEMLDEIYDLFLSSGHSTGIDNYGSPMNVFTLEIASGDLGSGRFSDVGVGEISSGDLGSGRFD
jgi:hypothetical protein